MESGFASRVHSLLKRVPKGRVTTYSALAKAAGSPGAARAVGNLMRANRRPDRIPCYKVVRSDGGVGGYSGPGGAEGKISRLKKDGVSIKGGGIVDFRRFLFPFKS